MKKVIERIVESHGAPNENDLWLNGATLKKFQNGEWIPVGGSMGEDEEYTIAQALNDLNERIEGLQEQVAQQDCLVISVPEGDGLIDVLPQEKATEYVKKGTLLGAIVCFEPITGSNPQGSAFGRIIAYEMDATDSRVINLQFAMRDGTTCLEYE